MNNKVYCVQAEAMPPIMPGDIIAVYSAHESAWGKPAQTYCVRRVESDGTPVSDMDFRHFLSDVVSVSRKVGDECVCIWKRENYEVTPWGRTYLQAFIEEIPEETKEDIADCFRSCSEIWNNFCKENKEAATAILGGFFALNVIKMAVNTVKGEAI